MGVALAASVSSRNSVRTEHDRIEDPEFGLGFFDQALPRSPSSAMMSSKPGTNTGVRP
jgi:hypothetical protein